VNKIIILFSSVFGVGYLKCIPGTFGGIIGFLLWMLFAPNRYVFQVFLLVVIFIVSVLFSSIAEIIYNKKDDQRIVIDEVAGSWFSVAFLPKTLIVLSVGLLLFRVFDIGKPLFVKKLQKLKCGFGITLDDIAAGILVNVILQIIMVVK
jgi:phosphatidylglycerophosphatase A